MTRWSFSAGSPRATGCCWFPPRPAKRFRSPASRARRCGRPREAIPRRGRRSRTGRPEAPRRRTRRPGTRRPGILRRRIRRPRRPRPNLQRQRAVRFDAAEIRRRAALANAYIQFSLGTAIEAVRHNRLRAALTSLGILFGVASVIAMLAIGKGAEREILEQLVLLGSNNIMVTPLIEQSEGIAQEEEKDEKQVKRYTPGLTYADAQAIPRVVPSVQLASAEFVLNTTVTREGRRRLGKLVGVDTTYFELTNLEIGQGATFTREQAEHGLPVAIIGYGGRARFFTTEAPIGKPIKVGDTWLRVIGVLTDRRVSAEAAAQLGVRDANMDVYVPVRTALLRYRDRARITQRDIEMAARAEGAPDEANTETETEEQRAERTNQNQLD